MKHFDCHRFKMMRTALNKSQAAMAKDLGIKQGSLSDIERGKTKELSMSVKKLLQMVYDINIDYLYNRSEELFRGSPPEGSKQLDYNNNNTVTDKFKNITTEDVAEYVLSHLDEMRLNGLFRSIIEKEKSKNIDGEEVVKRIMERLQPFYEIAMHHSIKLDEVKESIKKIKKGQ